MFSHRVARSARSGTSLLACRQSAPEQFLLTSLRARDDHALLTRGGSFRLRGLMMANLQHLDVCAFFLFSCPKCTEICSQDRTGGGNR